MYCGVCMCIVEFVCVLWSPYVYCAVCIVESMCIVEYMCSVESIGVL